MYDDMMRELNSRNANGIEVKLLWNEDTDRVLVSVEEEYTGDRFTFLVAAADALEAFEHPYAYAADCAWASGMRLAPHPSV
jgi:hypothetical protein